MPSSSLTKSATSEQINAHYQVAFGIGSTSYTSAAPFASTSMSRNRADRSGPPQSQLFTPHPSSTEQAPRRSGRIAKVVRPVVAGDVAVGAAVVRRAGAGRLVVGKQPGTQFDLPAGGQVREQAGPLPPYLTDIESPSSCSSFSEAEGAHFALLMSTNWCWSRSEFLPENVRNQRVRLKLLPDRKPIA